MIDGIIIIPCQYIYQKVVNLICIRIVDQFYRKTVNFHSKYMLVTFYIYLGYLPVLVVGVKFILENMEILYYGDVSDKQFLGIELRIN